jgi:hypothetical protein
VRSAGLLLTLVARSDPVPRPKPMKVKPDDGDPNTVVKALKLKKRR